MSDDRAKVLVVDDDKLIRELASDMVRRAGFEPVAAESGHDAIGILAVMQPMVVLMDLHMPQDPGDECCKLIKGNHDLSTVPVVFMTSADSEDEVRRAFFAGGDDYLQKPIRENQLASKLQAISRGARNPLQAKVAAPAKSVLIADDDGFFRSLVGNMLDRGGYQTIYAANGLDALRALLQGKQKVDLGIIDLVMPGIGGLELIRKVRDTKVLAQFPLLVVSGAQRTPQILEQLARLGVDEVIDKNALSIEHILARVKAELFLGDETRGELRARFYRVCEFRFQGEDWSSGFVYNLNRTGVAVRTLTPPPAQSVVDLRFHLAAGTSRVVTKATVVWSNEFDPNDPTRYPYGMGLRFAEVADETHRWIQEYLDKAGLALV